MAEVEDYLAHFGVKGMKWGVRRDRQSSGGHKKSRGRSKKQDLSSLSNQELQDRINRIQLESRYRQLTEKPSLGKRAAKATGKLVGKFILEVGKETAKSYLSAYTKGAINGKIIKKAPKVAKTMGLIK